MQLASLSYPIPLNAEWMFATADGCDAARCTALLAQLDAMPRTAWLEIGRRELARARTAAESTLDRTLMERGLDMTVWLVRDAVGTATHGASTGSIRVHGKRVAAAPCTPSEQRLMVAARHAAEVAALAHLARPWLPRDTYVALIAPFFFVTTPNS